MISSCSVIIRKPLGQEPATLGIRAAWAMFTVNGYDIKVILMGDGIFSALGKGGYIRKMYERLIAEEGEVYAVAEDMEARGVALDALPEGTTSIPRAEVSQLVEDTDSVLTF